MRYKAYRVRVYVGPTAVAHYTAQARKVGHFFNVFEGTEHVHADVLGPEFTGAGDEVCFRQRVCDAVYGASMAAGWRQVEVLRVL